MWLAQITSPLAAFIGLERAYLLTNLAAGVTTLWLVFSVTRSLTRNIWAASAAMVLCGGASSFVGLNNQFFVEHVQVTMIAAVLWVAAHAHRLSWLRNLAGIVSSVALAMLAKTTSVGFIAPFIVYIVVARMLTRHEQRPPARVIDYGLALGALVLAVSCVAWYTLHWTGVVAHAVGSASSDMALYFGSNRPFLSKFGFWSRELLRILSPFAWLAGAALFIGVTGLGVAVAQQLNRQVKEWMRGVVDGGLLLALCLAGTITLGVLAYSRQINEDSRLLAPMVPIVAVLFGWSVTRLRNTWLIMLALVTLGINAGLTQAAALGWVSIDGIFSLVQSPVKDLAAIDRMSRAVRESCDKARAPHYSIIGADLSDFNVMSAWFYAEKMRGEVGFSCNYAKLGFAEKDVKAAINVIYDYDADYFVTLPLDKLPVPGSDPFNVVSRPVAELMATNSDFTRVTPAGDSLVIYKRRR
jgi:hypothetical protein